MSLNPLYPNLFVGSTFKNKWIKSFAYYDIFEPFQSRFYSEFWHIFINFPFTIYLC